MKKVRFRKKHWDIFLISPKQISWKGALLICLRITFIDSFDILSWRLFISYFEFFFFTRYDWKVALIFSGDVRKTGVFGLKRMADEFPFRFIDLLFLCNSFLYFRLQLIRTKRFLRIQSSFDWQELYLYKGSLLYWKGVSAFCYGMFY